jgi:chaperone modulatory protein CbpM
MVTSVKLVALRGRLLPADTVAREAGLHPELVRRLVRIGFVDIAGGTPEDPLLDPDAPTRLARAARLRHDLGLSYSGALMAVELLDRIEALEDRLRRYED